MKNQGDIMRIRHLLAAVAALSANFPTQGAGATAPCGAKVGGFVSIEGAVEFAHAEREDWQPAKLESSLCEGDSIRVGANSRAAVTLVNDAVLRLDQNTTLRLVDVSEQPEERSLVNLVLGALKSFSRAPRTMTVNTPYVNGMIEGTEFAMRVDGGKTSVTVYEGKVKTVNPQGSLMLARGESAVAQAGQAPRPYLLINPGDASQWTLYYPPVFAAINGAGTAGSAGFKAALAAAGKGDTAGALALLDRVPEAERGAEFHIYRAALLLNVGRADAARADIDTALAQNPKAGLAYALKSIVEITRNQPQPALADAEKAVALSPGSASRIALSYAQQANLNIGAAKDTLLAAVAEEPGDPLAWARLGELWLMLGERGEALEAAREAEALAPNLARAQLVLGFVALAEFRDEEAKSAFERAVAIESSNPMGHFGLGLAKIYQGEVSEGRSDLEAAVGLGSSTGLLRAYLGKAYFEERRYPLDSQQFEIAKQLDPADPTAYLYDGILKQTVNRPVEALRDLETSIENNDNRAVYRSSQLLDQDRAARGTSQARAYRNLGFDQLGVRESTYSMSLDPTNASAHRFLSDMYLDVRRREIARVSELLQAQLYQDVNINPIQPSLSETNLNIITIGGPAGAGFNEFSPIFEQNKTQLNLSGFAGNFDTYGGEGTITSLYDRFSFSAGGYYYNSDGWRPNNGLNQYIYNFFGQAAITPDLNVQAEYRRRYSNEGDLAFNFSPDQFLGDKSISRSQDMARFGFRYNLTSRSKFVFSFIHNSRDEDQDYSQIDPFSNFKVNAQDNRQGEQYEGQYIYQGDWFNLIAGVAHSNVDVGSDVLLSGTFIDATGPQSISIADSERGIVQDTRGYLYSNVRFPVPVTWTLGFSYADYQAEPFNKTPFSPKFGVQWQVNKDLRLRAAVFRTLKPSLVNNRTIEPTQVAGFNQLFDDINGTTAWRYGGGFNWRLLENVYMGGEATWRDLQEPLTFNGKPLNESRYELNNNLYLYWTPTDRLSVRAEFVYDRYTSQAGIVTDQDNLPLKVQTFSAPLGVTYFDPNGIFFGVGGTYVNQNVVRSEFAGQASGQTSFFIVDTAIGYRFPKRYGIASFGIRNLFGSKFSYQDDSYREFRDEPSTGPYFPERTFLGKVTLNF
jgi:tetratricopeptide (TPR) repeat protein